MRSWGDLRGTRRVWAPELLTKTPFRRLPEASFNPETHAPFQAPLSHPQAGGQAWPPTLPPEGPTHLRTNLEVNLLKMLPEAPRRPWLLPEGEAGVTP